MFAGIKLYTNFTKSIRRKTLKIKNMSTIEKKANYILNVCKQKNRSLKYCLDYAVWITSNDQEEKEICALIRKLYK
jgi:hypothetical protein